MATKVWTDATMLYLFAGTTAGPAWTTVAIPAWDIAASMNGATGSIAYSAPASPDKVLIQSVALLDDDATIPAVITTTNIRIQFNYTVVCSGTTQVDDASTIVPILAGGGSGSYDENEDPTLYWGGTSRSDLFNGAVIWQFWSTAASASQQITISNFTVTVTYTTPSTPSVDSITPNTGTVNGGQAVTIRGEGFTGALGAEMGGVAVTSFVVVDDATITAVTPAHASGIVDVEVLGVATGTDLYTYVLNRITLPPLPTKTPMTQGGGKRRGR